MKYLDNYHIPNNRNVFNVFTNLNQVILVWNFLSLLKLFYFVIIHLAQLQTNILYNFVHNMLLF